KRTVLPVLHGHALVLALFLRSCRGFEARFAVRRCKKRSESRENEEQKSGSAVRQQRINDSEKAANNHSPRWTSITVPCSLDMLRSSRKSSSIHRRRHR